MADDLGDNLKDTAQRVRDEANRARGRIEQAIADARMEMEDDDDEV